MDTTKLSKLAGIAAIISGLLFGIIQFIHPANELASLSTYQWLITHTINFFFPILGLWGVTGIYARQVKQSGYIGLLGYVALFGAFTLMVCFAFYEAFIAPVLVDEASNYVTSALSILDGQPGPKYIGVIYQINGGLYLLGGLLFGISILKAAVYPKWAGGLLTAGVLTTLSAAILPIMARPSAVVISLGLMALGYALIANPSDQQT